MGLFGYRSYTQPNPNAMRQKLQQANPKFQPAVPAVQKVFDNPPHGNYVPYAAPQSTRRMPYTPPDPQSQIII